MRFILSYVDPGSGFIFTQGASMLWGVILGLGSIFILFFGIFWRLLKRFFWIFLILLLIISAGWIMLNRNGHYKKVVILGVDAMDPVITARLMAEGRLPNFSHLKDNGAYSNLLTTVPSESAVAWTGFATGVNPGKHGIFDFIMRDPENYAPYLSLNEFKSEGGKLKAKIRRKAEVFWGSLSKNKVPSFVYFCPNTFPAQPLFGRMLSGMGVPDITGVMGRFTFYTTRRLSEQDKESRGKIVYVDLKNNLIQTDIYGPRVIRKGVAVESTVPLEIAPLAGEEAIRIKFKGNDFSLHKDSWSDWRRISFNIGPFKKTYGIAKFYLKSVAPELELYMTAINFDPERPLFPISYPYSYSRKLSRKTGLYYTQGMPHDTWALSEGRLDEKAFLEHVDDILGENERILNNELREFKGGLFFYYFETLDVIQHMFWRYIDPKHPLYGSSSPYKDTIFRYYEKIDRILGNILKTLDKDTLLIVLSDHGFSTFRRAVHLNRWLLENGYLSLKKGVSETEGFLEDMDWSKTKAYALGFGGIYLNMVGREYYGIVNDEEAADLKKDIARGLKSLRDPQNNDFVVNSIYLSEDTFRGPYTDTGPDLFVGFNRGYRASWQTALGGVPALIIEDNLKKWSGDHLVDPVLVPGVIFINRNVNLDKPGIIDIASTILEIFGVKKPASMDGKELFDNEKRKDS